MDYTEVNDLKFPNRNNTGVVCTNCMVEQLEHGAIHLGPNTESGFALFLASHLALNGST